MRLDEIRVLCEKIRNNISKVIVGKEDVIDLILISLFCGGHVLLEDVPGVGKTMLAKCLAKSLECDFKRIQFTPDLLPTDLTGINYYNQKLGEFIFRTGPVFSNIILADEINRATPRTQSGLLECMEERQVTIDGETKTLNSPFFVIATQNPVETQGTYPLPEAQLDRFLMRLKIGYPSIEQGQEILERFQLKSPYPELKCVSNSEEIKNVQDSFSVVTVNKAVREYIIQIIEATRKHEKVSLGVSPRGSLALLKASQVLAILKGRDYVSPDDIKSIAIYVLAHRIILKGNALKISGIPASEKLISEILETVPAPVEELK